MREYTRRIARALKVVGLMNIQYAIKDEEVRAGSEPAIVTDGSVYLEGDRRADGEDCRARRGRAHVVGTGAR